MFPKEKTVCFTGHRPASLPWGYNENSPACLRLKAALYSAVLSAAEEGYMCFITGMALGADQYAAEAVIKARETYPDILLEAAVLCAGQESRWSGRMRERYAALLEKCAVTRVLSPFYTPGCMTARDRYMVDRSGLLIAVYNGTNRGGTYYTLCYAKEKGIESRVLRV